MDLYVAEFSPQQGAFHVEALGEALSTNREGIIRGDAPDYLPFAAAESAEAASRLCEQLRAEMEA